MGAEGGVRLQVLCDLTEGVMGEVLRQQTVGVGRERGGGGYGGRGWEGAVRLPKGLEPREGGEGGERVYLPQGFTVMKLGFGGSGSVGSWGCRGGKEGGGGGEGGEERSWSVRSRSGSVSLLGTPKGRGGGGGGGGTEVEEVVRRRYGGLSEEALSELSWKRVRGEIAQALGVEKLD